MRIRAWTVLSAGVLVLAAPGGGSGASAAGSPSAAGTADCASDARVLRIRALAALRFDPASVTVRAGQPVCFVVTNAGKTKHEFVVGDKAMQDEHEKEMNSGGGMESGGMDMGGDLEAELKPGETKSVSTTFDKAETLLYACHEPGHYKTGMIGKINVTE